MLAGPAPRLDCGPMSGPEEDYLLGMAPEEVARLGRQHEAWREPTARVLDAAGIRPGSTVVDLGCGPGFTSLELAARVGPAGRVVAVDASERALAELGRRLERGGHRNVEARRSEVLEADLAGVRPDVVFARWLLCYLAEPGRLVERVASWLPPGGRFAAIDYWNYRAIHAEPPASEPTPAPGVPRCPTAGPDSTGAEVSLTLST